MKLIEGRPRSPVKPDQVFTQAELKALFLNDIMLGCPGYEYLEKEFERPNWSPKKVLFPKLRKVIGDVCF